MIIDQRFFNKDHSIEALNGRKKIVVGMSGGVDSSVAAALLKAQGHEVIGMFMKNWEETDENGVCQSSKEFEDVVRVCEALEISYHTVDFVREYWDNVFTEFLDQYEKGNTPNPDILCNREIKFKVFLEKALEMGADFLATGHYAQIVDHNGEKALYKGIDCGKDQTYFIYTINKSILNNVLFPIGHLEKKKVREIATYLGLSTHDKKDSTGICFIGERNFRNFLSNYISKGKGQFKNLSGKVVGEHIGVSYYTFGQRKGLGLGGQGEPWFVVDKDATNNIVYVERGEYHPALYSDFALVKDLYWVNHLGPGNFPLRCSAKTRYRQRDQECTLIKDDEGIIKVIFDVPQRAMTPQQAMVFYQGEKCLGGGTISLIGPNYYQQKKVLPQTIVI